jgi:PAS domain S-box-containing protein
MSHLLIKFIFIILSGGIFAFGTFVYFQNRRGYLNRLFFLCAATIAYRSFCEGEMRSAGTLPEAVLWADTSFLRPFALAFFLHLMACYTGFWQRLNRCAATCIVYLPPAVFSIIFLIVYDKEKMLLHTVNGWVFANSFPGLPFQLHLVWALFIGLTVSVMLWTYHKKAAGDERTKTGIIAILYSLLLVIITLITLLKCFHMVDLLILNGIIIMTSGIIMGYLIWRYRLLIAPDIVMEEILGSMEDGLIIIGNDGKLKKVNKAILTLTGYSERELIEQPSSMIFPEEMCPDPEMDTKIRGKRALQQFESVISNKNGGTLPVSCAVSFIRHGKGVPTRIILCRDLSYYREIESELQKAQKLETFEMMVRSITHDFNNLLCSISCRLSIFDVDDTLPEKTKLDLKTTGQATQLAADLLKQFADTIKDNSMVKVPCTIAQLLEEASRIVRWGSSVNINLDKSLGTLPPVTGVHQQLMRVFLNLFINARQAMNENVSINVTGAYSPADNQVTISVMDNGPGMPKEVADRIFQPFFTTKSGGSGLGLSIVAGIIKNHSGTISVASTEGTGTTFIITLPLSSQTA